MSIPNPPTPEERPVVRVTIIVEEMLYQGRPWSITLTGTSKDFQLTTPPTIWRESRSLLESLVPEQHSVQVHGSVILGQVQVHSGSQEEEVDESADSL